MHYFVWDQSLDTGIDILDTQHKRIVDYINQLHSAISKKDTAAIEEVFNHVINYTLTHFAFEEKMMEQAGYYHSEAHKEVHRKFAELVRDYHRRLHQGEDVAKKLLSDLRIWLTNHIKTEDRDFAQQLSANLKGNVSKGWLARTLSRMFER